MASSFGTARAVKLHTFFGGGSARFKLFCVALVACGPLPWMIVHFALAGQARALVAPLGFLSGLFAVLAVQLRRQPKIYGSDGGLDLEWAWGTKRHLQWDDIRDVQELVSLGPSGVSFRLGLRTGSLVLCARRDFPERIYHLKLTRPTG